MIKFNLDTIEYQGMRNYECPDCGFNFLKDGDSYKHIIGWGNSGNRFDSKNKGVVFECPECFKRSYCHATEYYVKSVIRLKNNIK